GADARTGFAASSAGCRRTPPLGPHVRDVTCCSALRPPVHHEARRGVPPVNGISHSTLQPKSGGPQGALGGSNSRTEHRETPTSRRISRCVTGRGAPKGLPGSQPADHGIVLSLPPTAEPG